MFFYKNIPDYRSDEAFREIRALGILDHSGIPALHDVLFHKNSITIVEEYLSGKTLGYLIRNGFTPKGGQLTDLALRLSMILDYMHSSGRGIYHLDLHPDNIIISCDRLHIVDFGNSECCGDKVKGRRRGTPRFSAPELYAGGPVDERADIFSMGKIFLFLLEAAGDESCLREATILRDVAMHCIRERPEHRIQRASELVRILCR